MVDDGGVAMRARLDALMAARDGLRAGLVPVGVAWILGGCTGSVWVLYGATIVFPLLFDAYLNKTMGVRKPRKTPVGRQLLYVGLVVVGLVLAFSAFLFDCLDNYGGRLLGVYITPALIFIALLVDVVWKHRQRAPLNSAHYVALGACVVGMFLTFAPHPSGDVLLVAGDTLRASLGYVIGSSGVALLMYGLADFVTARRHSAPGAMAGSISGN